MTRKFLSSRLGAVVAIASVLLTVRALVVVAVDLYRVHACEVNNGGEPGECVTELGR